MNKIEDLSTPNCPAPTITFQNKIDEKSYFLIYNDKKYELIISIYDDKSNEKEKLFRFKLINIQKENENVNNIYYENVRYSSQLTKFFFINEQKTKNLTSSILEKIEKYHSNNNVSLGKNNKSEDIFDLIYTLKTIDNEEIELIIELNKKEEIIDEKNENNLLEQINYLKNSLKNLEQKYEKQNNIINTLQKQINDLTNNNIINIIKEKNKYDEEKQVIFKSNILNEKNITIVNTDIDGGRGVNDLFEIYHLNNDRKTVYLAVKRREENSDISYIDIIKIKSISNFKKVNTLKGHQKRINFIKYFINPYNKKEYLLSGDREEKIRVWGIEDENNYLSLIHIKTNYGRLFLQQSIYNCLLYFTEYRNYIYTTTVTENNSRLYDLEDGALLREISHTKNYYTFYLLRYKDYIVDVCRDFVIIYQLFNEEIYATIKCSQTNGDNRSACIIYDKNETDYLYISNSEGYIISYDLKQKKFDSIIYLGYDLYHIISWDLNSLIVTLYDSDYLGIVILDKKKNKIIKNKIKCNSGLICIKKIILNENEEIMLTAGEKNNNVYLLFSSTPESSIEEKKSNENTK